MRERDIAHLLAEREGGQCEVKTPAGNIDVLTAKYVYEVKIAHQWKAALGQVLAYARAYPDRKPRLYLFGDLRGMTKKAIEEHCQAVGVGVVWHRDEDVPPPVSAPPSAIADSMQLMLIALDASYGFRATSTIRLPSPIDPIAHEVLEAYADDAFATFDSLLDNALTIRISTAFGGQRQVIERTRASILGAPVCYQLKLTLATATPRQTFTVSVPGVRKHLFALPGSRDVFKTMNHTHRPIPALQRLIALATHPIFPWTSVHGMPTTSVERVLWRNYGIRQGKNGPVMGG